MATYFADTSFWIALSGKRDQYHPSAVAWSQFVDRDRGTILTTEAVLWEWMNALSDPGSRRIAAEGYRRCHQDADIEVVPFQSELIDSAVQLYEARSDKTWSLSDCLSFVVMERRQLTRALTTDRHFEQAGLRAMMLEDPPR
ncbi:MAG TPA: PIN domain-containing protein [Bryobacteraceae bacterium]|nr:PIN domain-containing protein [Bryobacteraceae bacterium]